MTRRAVRFLLDILPGLLLLAALALALLLMLPTPRGEPQTDQGTSGVFAVLPGAPEKVPASLATAGRVVVSMGDSDGSGAPPPQAAKGGGAAPRAGLAIGTSSARPASLGDYAECVSPCYVRVPPDSWHRSVATSYGINDGYLWGHLACGGRLDNTALVVAHRSLPCGTRVTFRFRGHVVTATVRDRGPYVRGREWDLGPAVARALHFNGLSVVEWRLE